MPSTYAHRRFGANIADHLPKEAAKIVERNREVYDIGLHGPDIFFYYHALKSNPVSALGNHMHEQPGAVFFEKARKCILRSKNQEAALAYVLGFICHFALDSTCHPYIEQYIRDSGVSHCEIECEFDMKLMRRDGLDPYHYLTASHIKPTIENAAVIAPFFAKDGLTLKQVHESLKQMLLLHKCLMVTSPAKHALLITAVKLSGKYEYLHGQVANLKPNPDCVQSSKQLEELYAKALPLAEKLILEYIDALHTDEPLNSAYQHTFGEN